MDLKKFRSLLMYIGDVSRQKTGEIFSGWFGRVNLFMRGCEYGTGLRCFGTPVVRKHYASHIGIGRNCVLRSAFVSNSAGLNRKCFLSTQRGATIRIGDDCGLSGTVIAASTEIALGNRVKTGVNCTLLDSDRHPLDPVARARNAAGATAPIKLEDDVWLGMNVTVLKGVTIGAGSVVCAGSVVTRSLPPGVLAGGVPAKVIRPLAEAPVSGQR